MTFYESILVPFLKNGPFFLMSCTLGHFFITETVVFQGFFGISVVWTGAEDNKFRVYCVVVRDNSNLYEVLGKIRHPCFIPTVWPKIAISCYSFLLDTKLHLSYAHPTKKASLFHSAFQGVSFFQACKVLRTFHIFLRK